MTTFIGTSMDDVFIGTSMDDVITGFAGNDNFEGRSGDDRIQGGNGNDRIKGGNGDDILRGGQGDDILRGGKGDDLLVGGRDNDQLFGGLGADKFEFGMEFGNDIVGDFNFAEGDSIILKGDLLESVFGISFGGDIEIDNPFGFFVLGLALNNDSNENTSAFIQNNDVIFDFGGNNTITFQGLLNGSVA
ncbi:MAG: calcium-binding protein [Nostocales cyanobacterium 94392]|nr:calcium-binding protein [Nostocales cyanobacterium 94392]